MSPRRKTRHPLTPNIPVLLWVIRNHVEKAPGKRSKIGQRDAEIALNYLDSMFAGSKPLSGCSPSLWPKQKYLQYYENFLDSIFTGDQALIGCRPSLWPKQKYLAFYEKLAAAPCSLWPKQKQG
jgi:hypothetical protein